MWLTIEWKKKFNDFLYRIIGTAAKLLLQQLCKCEDIGVSLADGDLTPDSELASEPDPHAKKQFIRSLQLFNPVFRVRNGFIKGLHVTRLIIRFVMAERWIILRQRSEQLA
ncbi:hypothetical protein CEXT_196271 [Caerostris extrusa]|uniref:Uncharacterized protein n=1 Tax=Caerostris extrusa TaxID=172846 RepID=A0AAV4VJE9_CAEEX|nr:hypothetical protein CEXT_196271 [Caerostris extrusa]